MDLIYARGGELIGLECRRSIDNNLLGKLAQICADIERHYHVESIAWFMSDSCMRSPQWAMLRVNDLAIAAALVVSNETANAELRTLCIEHIKSIEDISLQLSIREQDND